MGPYTKEQVKGVNIQSLGVLLSYKTPQPSEEGNGKEIPKSPEEASAGFQNYTAKTKGTENVSNIS